MIGRPAVSRDRWLVSYADFMTLLCAFITTLYAAAIVRAANPVPVGVRPASTASVASPAPASPDAVRDRLEAALAEELQTGRARLVDDPRGLVIEVPELAAFGAGRADVAPDARVMMRRLAGVLKELPNGVRVEGHTDDTPIASTRFASNWDLSTARATAVVAVFVAEGGLDPARLSAAGYSEFRPRASNGSPDGRSRNRRVDVVVLNRSTESREEPAPRGETP